jgi:hypothetical protein
MENKRLEKSRNEAAVTQFAVLFWKFSAGGYRKPKETLNCNIRCLRRDSN